MSNKKKSDYTKEYIIRVAEKFFITYGYEKTLTRKIADEVNVSEALLFKYFPTKEELFIEAFKYSLHNSKDSLETYFTTEEPLQWLRSFAYNLISPDEHTSEQMIMFRNLILVQLSHYILWALDDVGDLEELLVPIVLTGQEMHLITEKISAKEIVSIYWRYIFGTICSTVFAPDMNNVTAIDSFLSLIEVDES